MEASIEKTKMVSIAILLPSGVGQGKWQVSVGNGGTILELTVNWLFVLLNMDALHTKRLCSSSKSNFSRHHPQFPAFENALRGLRERVSDTIESTARFSLPFPVETHIYCVTPLLHSSTSSKILYVALRAYADNYTVVNNSTAFAGI